ncbi:hypothetical protein BJ170DRAFT_563887, partial [Xylariales sp. AK1849]
PTSLSVLCDKTAWTEGLWLQCHSGCGENKTSFCGGLTNARNRIQTCIRLAIDAGASVIIPSVTTRAEDDLLNTNQRSVCPNEWWNTNRLQSVMNRECPQLKMQFCEVDVPDSRILEPEYRNYLAEGHRNSTFEALMRETMNSSGIEPSSVSPKNQVVLKYGDTYIAWDYAKSDEMSSIRKDLFNALTYNATLLGFGQDILNSPQLEESAFIGVHLRGEGDWPSGFGSAYDQMSRYVEAIENITKTMPDAAAATVYVSCGDQNAIQTFREILEPLNYTVHDKWTLLADQPAKLARIETLGFDQKGIVEYEVLTHSRFWMGISMSSMSALIAYARTSDDEKEFFETYIYPGSSRSGLNRHYANNMVIRGNAYTKLLVVSGVDIMESFP